MRLVMMNGGLGNQAFQYIFMRYIEEHSGEPCIIDDLAFCREKVSHNGYELEKIFSLKPRRLSQMLSEDVVQEILKLKQPAPGTSHPAHDIVSILRTSGISLNVIQEADLYEHDYHVCLPDAKSYPINQFSPQILRNHGNLYYYGYWINAYWYEAIMDVINYEFTFPLPQDLKNAQLLHEVLSSDRSVCIHIRRGDFIDCGWLLNEEFYRNSVASVKKVMKPVFYIFSDDMPYVKEHLSEYGLEASDEIIFVEGNTHGKNYIDMQLMAACQGMIIANSSFSYLAALLNRRADRFVYNPTTRDIV